MNRSKIILTLALAVVFVFPGLSAAEPVDGIAIVVNDSVVTLSEYGKKEREIKSRFPQANRKEIVNAVVQEMILTQTAEGKNLSVSKDELAAAVKIFKQSQELNDEGLVNFLAKKQTTLNEFFSEIKIQLLTSKLVRHEVERLGFSMDEKKIEEFYLRINPDASRDSQVRIAHILLPKNGSRALENARAIADRAKAEGADFAALSLRHSTDVRTASKGGDLGYFTYGELIKPLREAVDGAQAGDINGPVESKAGFHIVKVIAIKEGGTLVPPEMRLSLIDKIATIESERIIASLIEEGVESSHIDVRIPQAN
ncbi:peptidylprolyl isomerase [Candidatus Mycalebacterium sp.]